MVTKGFLVERIGNKWKVRIPYFESAGMGSREGSNISSILECSVSDTSGVSGQYKVDDVVFVAFEDSKPNKPVIIGKLLSDKENENRGLHSVNAINVSGSANLPANTTIGDISAADLRKMKRHLDTLQDFREDGDAKPDPLDLPLVGYEVIQ